MQQKRFLLYCHTAQDGYTLKCREETWKKEFRSLAGAYQYAHALTMGNTARLTVFGGLGNVLFEASLGSSCAPLGLETPDSKTCLEGVHFSVN
jgi:hypothetical protein